MSRFLEYTWVLMEGIQGEVFCVDGGQVGTMVSLNRPQREPFILAGHGHFSSGVTASQKVGFRTGSHLRNVLFSWNISGTRDRIMLQSRKNPEVFFSVSS